MSRHKQMQKGDKVYVPERPHKTKANFFSANGVVSHLIWGDDGLEEVQVTFELGDRENYNPAEFEWTDSWGGTWVLV